MFGIILLVMLYPNIYAQETVSYNQNSIPLPGNYNTGIGYSALGGHIFGQGNTAVGHTALHGNKYGYGNTALGDSAGVNNNGNGNIFLGHWAGISESGSNKLYIGNRYNNIIYGNIATGQLLFGVTSPGSLGNYTFKGNRTLNVVGGIITDSLKIAPVDKWADHVFDSGHKLLPINELQDFIKQNGHLPNIPSKQEVSKNGLELVEFNALLLEKVEELTLYILEQAKKQDELTKRLQSLEQKLNALPLAKKQ
jgi:hypothetical protein